MATQNIFDLTDTWNNVATTFTAIKMNATDTASASGSLLIDLQIGGSSRAKVAKTGQTSINMASFSAPAPPADTCLHINGVGTGSQTRVLLEAVSTNTRGILAFRRARDAGSGVPGAVQSGDSLGVVAVFGYGATAYSSSSRGSVSFQATENWTDANTGNSCTINTQGNAAAGSRLWTFDQDGSLQTPGVTGGATGVGTVNAIALYTNGNIVADTNGLIRKRNYTVATLPAAASLAGAAAFVTDANATTFASIVAAGGANGVPVYSDGTNWRIG